MESGSGRPVDAAAEAVFDLSADDLSEVATLHVEAFPDSELTRLGHEAVRRNYLWQFEGPHDLVALGVRSDGRLVGFLFGGVFRGSTIGFVKREHWFLLGRVLRNPSMIVNAKSLSRIGLAVRLLSRRTGPPQSENPAAVPPRSFGVLSVAVDPSTQGSGVGQVLMAEAEARARAAGFARMHLTVHPENHRAVRFYEEGGWSRAEGADGTWIGQMTLQLDDAG
ncbi:GNAT family N-acetyltransferase [Aquihabitans daechungensis]|uniref:GNAT family N-acetyltransferase n=1 Tax=Aquihabitans daechungensis TaxID=1052257 RepID=UPI003B9DF0A3